MKSAGDGTGKTEVGTMRSILFCFWAWPLVCAFGAGCGEKKEPPKEKRKPAQARPGPARPPAGRPGPRTEPPAPMPRTRPVAAPTSDARTPGPPPQDAKISAGGRLPHNECNVTYRAGSKNFDLRNYEDAVAEFVRFVSGQCWGRITRSTEVWLSYRAFHATCRTKDGRYQNAFKALLEKACAGWGADRPPCNKAKRCPARKSTDHFQCNDLYKKGSAAAKAKDHRATYDTFTEFEKLGCFGSLTPTSDQWAAYRAMKAAEALGKPRDHFVDRLKVACRANPGWPCRHGPGK